MTFTENIDQEKLAEAALAILSLTAVKEMGTARAWKGMDWDLLDVLYQKGWIFDPVGKQKSVVFTDEGMVVIAGKASHGAGVDIDGTGTVAMQLKTTQVLCIQGIKAFLFSGFH